MARANPAGLITGLRVWMRMIRTGPALVLAILVTSFVSVVLVTTGSRLFVQVSDDDLRQAIETGEAERRSVTVRNDLRIGAGSSTDPFSVVRGRGERFIEQDFPQEVSDVVNTVSYTVESPPFRVSSFPNQVEGPFPTTFRFRYQSGIEDQMTVVSGHLPETKDPIPMLLGNHCPDDRLSVDSFEVSAEPADEGACAIVDVPVYEVALTAQSAEAMMLAVGDQVILRPDPEHIRWRFGHGEDLDLRIVLTISAIIELSDASGEYWFSDDSLHRPRITETADFRLVFAQGVMRPDRYRRLLEDIPDTHFDFVWRYGIDSELVVKSDAAKLAVRLDQLRVAEAQVSTQLPGVIADHLGQRVLVVGLMSTAYAGFLIVSVLATNVLASLAARRQSPFLGLMADRGLSRWGVMSIGLAQGLAVGASAILAGLAIAAAVVREGPWLRPMIMAGALAILTVLAVAVSVWKRVISDSKPGIRPGNPSSENKVSTARRIVRDIAVIVLALGSIYLLRRRADLNQAVDSDFDLLLAVVPAVVGLAVALAMTRISVPVVRAASWLASFSSGLALYLGIRRLSVATRSARPSIAVILIAVGIAGFATIIRASITEARSAHGWQAVGADIAIRGQTDGDPILSITDDDLADAQVVARGAEYPMTRVINPSGSPAVRLVAIDAESYRMVLADSAVDVAMLDALEPGSETSDAPEVIPGIISGTWPGTDRPAIGSAVRLFLGARVPTVRVVAVAGMFPSVPPDQPFVIVDMETFQALDPSVSVIPTVLLLKTSSSTEDEITAAVARESGSDRLISRRALEMDAASDELNRFLDVAMLALSIFTFVVALMTALLSTAITGPVRRRDMALLRQLGLRRRQAFTMTLIEQLVPVVVAVAIGTALGIAIARLLAPTIDLGAVSGGQLPAPIVVSWPLLIAGGLGIVAAVTAGAIASAVRDATGRPGELGFEQAR